MVGKNVAAVGGVAAAALGCTQPNEGEEESRDSKDGHLCLLIFSALRANRRKDPETKCMNVF